MGFKKVIEHMEHFVYVLVCSDGTLYTGYTNDLQRRLKEHNGEGETDGARTAGARYTRSRRPVALLYHKSYLSKSEAMRQEYWIKKLSRAQKLQFIKEETTGE